MQDPIQIVSHYALQKKLSHKAGRQTFLAEDLRTHVPAIVKVLQLDSIESWSELKLFQREAQILQQLSHPAVPKYKESFEADVDGVTSFVSVQSYIAARSLQDVIEERVEAGELFSEAEAIVIAQSLLSILNYLHHQLPPVVHRDIKPSNVLISEPETRAGTDSKNGLGNVTERNVYLVDFGAVQITASKTSGTMTIVGSYGYMPLEQFLGQTTPASDLYSLGMLLLYLVTGMHPAELPERDGCIQVEHVAKLAGLSDRFTHWLSKLTEPYVQKRFPSAEIALTVLSAKDGKNGYFPHLKPVRTIVHVHRQPDELTLISRLYTGNIVLIACSRIPPLLTFGISVYAMFTAPVLAIAAYFILLMISTGLKEHSERLYPFISIHRTKGVRSGIAMREDIHRPHFFKKKQLFKGQQSQPLEAINFISYRPKHDINPDISYRRFFKRGVWSLPPEISVNTVNSTYKLPFSGNLSAQEQAWLSQELEDFTGTKLQTIIRTERKHVMGSHEKQENAHVKNPASKAKFSSF